MRLHLYENLYFEGGWSFDFLPSCTFQVAGPSSAAPKLAIVMEFCRYGNLFKMLKDARNLQAKMNKPGYTFDPRMKLLTYYRFYTSWERRLEVRRSWRHRSRSTYIWLDVRPATQITTSSSHGRSHTPSNSWQIPDLIPSLCMSLMYMSLMYMSLMYMSPVMRAGCVRHCCWPGVYASQRHRAPGFDLV